MSKSEQNQLGGSYNGLNKGQPNYIQKGMVPTQPAVGSKTHNRMKQYAAAGQNDEISNMIQSPRGAIGSYSGMVVGSPQGVPAHMQQQPQRFQNLNIMSRRKSGAATGAQQQNVSRNTVPMNAPGAAKSQRTSNNM